MSRDLNSGGRASGLEVVKRIAEIGAHNSGQPDDERVRKLDRSRGVNK
jgi:hypothetical protein